MDLLIGHDCLNHLGRNKDIKSLGGTETILWTLDCTGTKKTFQLQHMDKYFENPSQFISADEKCHNVLVS